ncbi:hypothetical protein ABMC88_16615 [Sulfitobacter sp. HNIBRBA2951]|uniref:hypothetical protein n=1 Tax=Sulfitobacter aquimarinus TaxID=3158557 RepID=UPI0032DE822F
MVSRSLTSTTTVFELSDFGLGFSGGTNRYTRIITNKQIALENTDETNPNVVIS